MDCFFPKRGEEFAYLGKATYLTNWKGMPRGTDLMLLDFYRKLDRLARPRLCPAFVLRLLLMAELRGFSQARRLRLRLIKGIEVRWSGWKLEKFRIKGSFTPEAMELVRRTSREIEDSCYVGWLL